MSSTRQPAFAGRFYPADARKLREEVQAYLTPTERLPALGCIVPHAGYLYSGHVAGAVFSELQLPSTVIVLCPNHSGRGAPLAIYSAGDWETPLGRVPVDEELAKSLKEKFPLLSEDLEAHRGEHSAEVELPFLQVLRPYVKIVPIAIGTTQLEVLEALGEAIAGADALILASSDMNHYESDAVTRVKDRNAIDKVLELDEAGLYETVRREKITMCGIGPAVAMLIAVKKRGARSAKLVSYATSGDVSQNRDTVVGYAGIIIK